MANKVRGQIKADFNGQPIGLILTTNALCSLEEADGRPINDILEEIGTNPRMGTVRRMFWAMMLQGRPEATIADAGALIDGLAGQHTQIISDAVSSAFPDAPKGGEPGKSQAATGTG